MHTDNRDKAGYAPRLWALGLIALFPALNLGVFGPVLLFLDNVAEFDTELSGLWPRLAGASAIGALAMVAVAWPLGPSGRRRLAAILFTLGVLTWLQGAFLMHDYGVLDGRGIQWQRFGWLAAADALIWIVALVLAVGLADKLARVAAFGAVAFMLVQAVPLVTEFGGGETPRAQTPSAEPPAGIFRYSADRNIVHLVLDNFQTDVFLELVAEGGFEQAFDGFVVFTDNAAVTPHTSLAVPAILSGSVYDGARPPGDYYLEALRTGMPATLMDRGYRVNLVSLQSMTEAPHTNHYVVPSLYRGTERDRRDSETAHLLDVSLFRQVPHAARRWVYADGNWRFSRLVHNPASGKGFQHRKFLEDYIDRLELEPGGPAYHFMHLWPPHPPFSTTASGRYAGRVLSNTRENYLNEARPVVRLLARLLDRLRELGAYDDALIVVQSDHGGGFEPEPLPPRVLALLAVKPAGSSGRMRFSDEQTSVSDVAATIMDQSSISDHDYPGRPVFAAPEGERLRRFVYVHEGEHRAIEIQGSASNPDSYGPSRPLRGAASSREYRFGETVRVGLVGDGQRFLAQGWAAPAAGHVWSSASEASLLLQVDEPAQDARLTVELIPHVDPDRLPGQRIVVLVNGRRVGEWLGQEQRRHRLEMDVPRELIDGPELQITFRLPDAASPAELGTGSDGRQLGIALIEFRLDG